MSHVKGALGALKVQSVEVLVVTVISHARGRKKENRANPREGDGRTAHHPGPSPPKEKRYSSLLSLALVHPHLVSLI